MLEYLRRKSVKTVSYLWEYLVNVFKEKVSPSIESKLKVKIVEKIIFVDT
jgi:hypothetical protein